MKRSEALDGHPAAASPAAPEIQAWLTKAVAEVVKADDADIDPEIPFDRFGLDSVAAVDMTERLSQWLGRELSPTLLYDYPTVALLSEYLAGASRSSAA